MSGRFLHIWRNTPMGREVLEASASFCEATGLELHVYVPRHPQFLMYFGDDVVTVPLDGEFLHAPETAEAHAEAVLARHPGLSWRFTTPVSFTASTLPDLPVDWNAMCCPRSLSDLSARIGLGTIGPRVRRIVRHATFPVLLPQPVFRPWKRVLAMVGPTESSLRVARVARTVARTAGRPLELFTFADGRRPGEVERWFADHGFPGLRQEASSWHLAEGDDFLDALFPVPGDALVVLGAYGRRLVRELLLGTVAEKVQEALPNPLLLVGPRVDDEALAP